METEERISRLEADMMTLQFMASNLVSAVSRGDEDTIQSFIDSLDSTIESLEAEKAAADPDGYLIDSFEYMRDRLSNLIGLD